MKKSGKSKFLEAFLYEKEFLKPSHLVEKHRVITTGNLPGRFSFEFAPWARAYIDTMMPENKYRVIGLMGSSQVGKTVALANLMLAVFKQYSANMLFMSQDKGLVKTAMSGFIAQMIRESGIQSLIGRPRDGSGSRGSGDTDSEKKFGNGNYTLYTWTGQTVHKLANIDPKYGFIDEVERYKNNSKAGTAYSLILNRFKTYGSFYKVYFASTPEDKDTSIIEPIYLQGDRNKYYIPCKCCGVYIDLEWSIKLESGDYAGITYKRTNVGGVEPRSVGYLCQECGGYFKEAHKFEMYYLDNESQRDGRGGDPICLWKPTNIAIEPDLGSFHINTLYSGKGMCSWLDITKNWCQANPVKGPKKIDDLKTFYNQMLGKTWAETSRAIASEGLIKNCRSYMPGVVPDVMSEMDGNGKILMLVCAVDLNGLMDAKNPDNDDVRLNYSVRAFTENGNDDFCTSYYVMHGVIGNFERASEKREREMHGEARESKWTYRHGMPNSVWDKFEKEVLFRDWHFESGRKERIMLCCVDTGNYTIYANEFVSKHNNCIGVKGGRDDEFAKIGDVRPYVKQSESPKLWKVDGNRIKDRIWESINASWRPELGEKQPVGHMNFPSPTDDLFTRQDYFIEYEGERRTLIKNALGQSVGWSWGKKESTSRQHYFDCCVYEEAALKIAVKVWCSEAKVEVTFINFVKLIKYYMEGKKWNTDV